jgi:shikimate kinase
VTPKVVLVGLPGAGKTTTGRRLAKMLAVPFADSDDLVEHATGQTVREIFAVSGEAEFRAQEAAAIAVALRDFDGVLSLGGGALTRPETRAALSESGVAVVLLLASVRTLRGRVGDAHTRPLLAGDTTARLRELADERAPLYESVATLTVRTEKRTPGQAAAVIAARLHERAESR